MEMQDAREISKRTGAHRDRARVTERGLRPSQATQVPLRGGGVRRQQHLRTPEPGPGLEPGGGRVAGPGETATIDVPDQVERPASPAAGPRQAAEPRERQGSPFQLRGHTHGRAVQVDYSIKTRAESAYGFSA